MALFIDKIDMAMTVILCIYFRPSQGGSRKFGLGVEWLKLIKVCL